MEASVYSLLCAEEDTKTNISSSPNATSSTGSEKVINSKTDSTLVKEQKSDEELLEGLLTEYYCHVCSSNLLFESNRLAHYKGKKHAQEVKKYLSAVRAELARGGQNMVRDKNRFCDLCNIVFNSHIVAKSHYEGKIHAKNLRKKSLPKTEKGTAVQTEQSITPDLLNCEQNSFQQRDLDIDPDPTGTSNIPDASVSSLSEVDIKDPEKYCALCAASFNRPEMALQHYNGLKHQRRIAQQKLLKNLGKDVQPESLLMCNICNVSFNSVKVYQTHMQGNKHQIREGKLKDVLKSQSKVFGTFADELADYIQVQKARGITPKTSQVLPDEEAQNKDEEEDKVVLHEESNQCDLTGTPVPFPNLPQPFPPPLQPIPGTWFPFYPVPSWPPFGWPYNFPPPVLPCPGSTQFASWPTDGEHQRQLSTSSTCSSSTYSDRSCGASDSDECERRTRKGRKTKRHQKDGEREGDEDLNTEERRRKRRRMETGHDSEERRGEESWEELRGKKLKSHRKRTQKQKTFQQEDFEVDQEGVPTERLHSRSKSEHTKSTKARKEKKRIKDSRTEEEKLWDDSILGC
ncbi:PREDICTED: lysine-rich coiled-coil protein 1 [Cyprinodon variegatus]|uniref:lysine-rich coiled-coil protein 1 n=1 Tax=Cyprinodon variegatus TaxID=28743 RepID=UPI000742BDCF|nr:PREDICTED: lysine-rich coiled-coil protein 1 [Cyprinodon variegatus]